MSPSDRQSQKAGDGSNQVQVHGNIIIQQGITEERAHEIARQASWDAVAIFTHEALEIANARISELDQKVIERFAANDTLDAFVDPAFQHALQKAQVGAAVSDQESDLDLLVGLLESRVTSDRSRHLKASIGRAVELVDQLDGEALNALTVTYAFTEYGPSSPEIIPGLSVLDGLFADLSVTDLPRGKDWMDHLDVLGAIRIQSMSTLLPLAEILSRQLIGYVSPGVETSSLENPEQAYLPEVSNHLTMVPHELLPGRSRAAYATKQHLRNTVETYNGPHSADEYIASAAIHVGFGNVDPGATEALGREIAHFPNLHHLQEWWDQIPTAFDLNSVSKALAIANLKRLPGTSQLPGLEM